MRPSCLRLARLVAVATWILLWIPTAQAISSNLARGFPRLDNQFKVIDRNGQDYNCIAFTLGIQNQWIDPKTGPASNPFSFMDKLYGANGYRRTPTLDLRDDPNLQKVAIYATRNANGSIKAITHAALQDPGGAWLSKLGHLPLIRHADPNAVDGPTYGQPVATYVRDRGNAKNPSGANAGPARSGNASPVRQSAGVTSTSTLAGAARRTGTCFDAGRGQRATNSRGSFTSMTKTETSGVRGLGPLVSDAAHHGVHGTALAAYIHELQARRDKNSTFATSFTGGFQEAGKHCRDLANSNLTMNTGNAGLATNFAGRSSTNISTRYLAPANSTTAQARAKNSGMTGRTLPVGNAKKSGNTLNTLAGNQSLAKSARNTNGRAQNAGNARSAGNSLTSNLGNTKNIGDNSRPQNTRNVANARKCPGSLVGNNDRVRSASTAFNQKSANNRSTTSRDIGSSPGRISININGNGNTVIINGNRGASKSAGNGAPGVIANKQNVAPQMPNRAKQAGTSNGATQNAGRVKQAGNSANGFLCSSGRVRGALNTAASQNTRNAGKTQNSPGAFVGNNAMARNASGTTNQAARNRSQGPGAMVGKAGIGRNVSNKTAGSTQCAAKNAGLSPTSSLMNLGKAKNGGNNKSGLAVAAKTKNAGASANVAATNQKSARNVGTAKIGPQNAGSGRNAGHVVNALAATNHGMAKNVNRAAMPGATNSAASRKTGSSVQHKSVQQSRASNVQTMNRSQPAHLTGLASMHTANRSQQSAARQTSAFHRGVSQANCTGRKK